jgi:hypothetical protein
MFYFEINAMLSGEMDHTRLYTHDFTSLDMEKKIKNDPNATIFNVSSLIPMVFIAQQTSKNIDVHA